MSVQATRRASRRAGAPAGGRVLLAQTSFLGDVVLTTALARVLEEATPEVELWWLVRPEAVPLLEPRHGAERVLAFDKRGEARGIGGAMAIARKLRELRFDAAIGVQRSLRTAAVLAAARIPLRVGYAGSAGAWLYHRRVPKIGVHARDRLVALATGLGVCAQDELPRPVLSVDAEAVRRVEERLAADGAGPEDGVLVVAPGSAWATKQLPARSFGASAAALQRPGRDRVVILGTPKDQPLAAEIGAIVAAAGGRSLDATTGTTIADAVAWIGRSRLVLANDSAPAHIAGALDRPVVAAFGPTVPEQGFAPLGERVRIVGRSLDCRPCSRHGGDRCPIGTHECLEALPVSDVVDAARSLLDDPATGSGS